MKTVYVITHPDVVIDPNVPVPQWPLSAKGRERIAGLMNGTLLKQVTAVYSSDEQKALDGAWTIAQSLGLKVAKVPTLGEVDRSSTGYLPREKHDQNARLLFEYPHDSIEGWEIAIEAQYRMVTTVYRILEFDKTPGPIVIMTHGAVGSFLYSHLKKRKISLADSPKAPGGGGIFSFEAKSLEVLTDWQDIDVFAPKVVTHSKSEMAHNQPPPHVPLGRDVKNPSETRI